MLFKPSSTLAGTQWDFQGQPLSGQPAAWHLGFGGSEKMRPCCVPSVMQPDCTPSAAADEGTLGQQIKAGR